MYSTDLEETLFLFQTGKFKQALNRPSFTTESLIDLLLGQLSTFVDLVQSRNTPLSIVGILLGSCLRVIKDKALSVSTLVFVTTIVLNCMWNLRMFMLYGDAKYIDVLERSLYNGVLSGISLDGKKFFYPNVLSCDKSGSERSE